MKTIVTSSILSRKEEKSKNKLNFQNFKHLCNVFGDKKKEEISCLLDSSPTLIVEHEEISYRQDNNLVIRWAVYILKNGLKTLKKKFALMKSQMSNSSINFSAEPKIKNPQKFTQQLNKRPIEDSTKVIENIRQYGMLIKILESIKYKNLNLLNSSVLHILFILFCCKIK